MKAAYEEAKQKYQETKRQNTSIRLSAAAPPNARLNDITNNANNSKSAIRTGKVQQQLPSHIRNRLVLAALERLQIRRPRPLNPPSKNSELFQDVYDKAVVEIRVAGIRRGREKQILQLLDHLKRIQDLHQEDASWIEHSSDVALAALRHLEHCDRKMKAMAKVLEEAVNEKNHAASKVQLATEHLKKMSEQAKANTMALREQMSAEAEKTLKDVAAEHEKVLNAQNETAKKAQQDLSSLKSSNIELRAEKKAQNIDHEQVVGELNAKIQEIQAKMNQKSEQVKDLEMAKDTLKKQLATETEQLNTAEEKVVRILAAKDLQIEKFKKRAVAAEKQLYSLDEGFSELLS